MKAAVRFLAFFVGHILSEERGASVHCIVARNIPPYTMGASASLSTPLAVPIPGSLPAAAGQTPVFRSAASPGALISDFDGVTTLYENFQYGMKVARVGIELPAAEGPPPPAAAVAGIHAVSKPPAVLDPRGPDKPCLGHRQRDAATGKLGDYRFWSYGEVEERALQLGSALLAMPGLNLQPKKGMVGIFSRNCPNWVVVEQACNAYSLITVPLYDTLGQEAVSPRW